MVGGACPVQVGGAGEAQLDARVQPKELVVHRGSMIGQHGVVVGEAGLQLSGGQRQLLELARALLADAPVLLLDEPTAHVDPETADELVRDVFASAGDRTILLITHRPEGLDLVDEVVPIG